MNEKIQYWLELAEYDMLTAEAMFATKRYLYVGFMCCQIAEKMLNAYFVKSRNQTPPFTHNLRFLAEESGLTKEMTGDRLLFLIGLQPLNIEARYPSYKENLLKNLNQEKCESLISKTREFYEWIKPKL